MLTKIKILHIHTRAIVGGSGSNTLLSMEGLDKERYEAVLATNPEGPLIDEAKRRHLRVEPIRHMVNRIDPIFDILALLELISLMKKENFTIVHTHNSKAGILGRLAAWLCGVPIIIHTIHSCVFKYPNLSGFQRRLFFWIERLINPITDKFITISEPLKQEFINAGFGSPDRFVTIYSGIELDRFKTPVNIENKKEEIGIKREDLVVGAIARFDEGKGYEEFIKAAAMVLKALPKARFILVGDGPLKQTIENMATNMNIFDRCIFTGIRGDVSELTATFDISVLASHYEGMGRVLLEAQARGVPVVATRVGGIPDIVKDGETGLLVEVGDIHGLSKAIATLLNDKPLREKMGNAATRWLDERFSATTMVNKIARLYEELLNVKCINS